MKKNKSIEVDINIIDRILDGEPKELDLRENRKLFIRSCDIVDSLYNRDQSLAFFKAYLKKTGNENILDNFSKIKDKIFSHTCHIIKLKNNGCILSDEANRTIDNEIIHLNSLLNPKNPIVPKLNIDTQKIDIISKSKVKQYENPFILKIENIIDDRLLGKSMKYDFKTFIKENNISANQCAIISTYYKPIYDEVHSNERDVKEGYNKYSKEQMAEIRQFYKDLYDSFILGSHYQKRVNSNSRKSVKKVDIDKLVKNIKYQQNSSELGIVSLSPKDIIDKDIVILYNSKNRVIFYVKAKKDTKISIKGNKVINFDELESFSKRVRNPSDLVSLMIKAKMDIKRGLETLSTKPQSPSVISLNENMLILKTFK